MSEENKLRIHAQKMCIRDRGEMLGMTVTVGENPQDDVAVGTCIAAADDHIAARFAQSGCLIEL